MQSSKESFDEEGEIFESEVEKAPPSLPSVISPSVDRHSSRPNRKVSPPPSRPAPSRERDDHPVHHWHEFDDRRDRSLRVGKRRRVDADYEDPRPPRQHHDSEGKDLPLRRPRVSYADIDHSNAQDIPREHSRDFGRGDHYVKRSRTRSRSPGADYARDSGPGRRGLNGRGDSFRSRYDDRRRDARGGHREVKNTRNTRDHAPQEQRDRPASDRRDHPRIDRRREENRPLGGSQKPQTYNEHGRHKIDQDKKKNAELEPGIEILDPVDEAKLIEERRKKREAIKAKYRGQVTPLLATALGIKDGTSKDSSASSPAEVISETTPRTPASPQEPPSGGTFDLTKEGAEKEAGDHTEGPSAADYDPTIDMQEDRTRNEHRLHYREVSSGAYNEVKSTDRDVLLPDAPEHPLKPVQASEPGGNVDDDFDMFAEGDDDMFAPAAPAKVSAAPTVAKAVPIVEAQQLDASLLDNWDDPEGYYKTIHGELLDHRYRVQNTLGKGMFSSVVRAYDQTTEKTYAIKIIRANESMRKSGQKEIDILTKIREADPDDKRHVIRFERIFEHKGHLCMVFENLNMNLREVLKKSGIRDVGISLKAVRAYAGQIFLGLALLRKCNILHADLKPDNILVSENQSFLKICDLGSASDASDNEITPYLVSRFYRAPEIILGIPYDFAIDMWSAGCTLFELYTGKILFTGRNNNQMLRSIMECRGKFPNKMLKRSGFFGAHFDENGGFRSFEQDKVTGKDIVRTLNFQKPSRELKSRLMAAGGKEEDQKELSLFIDLLDRCLTLVPEKRCVPAEALKHPFIHRPVGGTAQGSSK